MKLKTMIITCLTLATLSIGSSLAMEDNDGSCSGSITVCIFDGFDNLRVTNNQNNELFKAMRNTDVAALRAILESRYKTVNANVADEQGWTPLLLAAAGRPVEMLKLLLARGVDLQACTKGNGYTALHWATIQGTCEAMRALIVAGADVNAKGKTGETALHKAVRNNDGNKVQILLEAGASVHVDNAYGETPLFLANGPLIAQKLVDAGADVSKTDTNGNAPIHSAVKRGLVDIVKVLLAANADTDVRTRWGDTPLHFAAGLRKKDIVKVLIEAGADVNSVNNYGNTPLHESKVAAEIAQMLFAAGANATLRYGAGKNGVCAIANNAILASLLVTEKLA